MKCLRVLTVLCTALVLGACSDSQSPAGPSEASEAGALDVSSGGDLDLAKAPEPSTNGIGLSANGTGATTEAVACRQNGSHRACFTFRQRNGGILIQHVSARGILRFRTCSLAQAFFNGFKYSQGRACGRAGDVLFANHPRDVQTFRGDVVCHRWTRGISGRDVCVLI